MTSRFLRFAVLFVLLLLTAQVAQPYILRLMYSATTPKPVVPRGNLSEAEQATIALFDHVSPSVVQVVGRQSGERALGDDTEGTGVQSGTGFIWDRAGNIVTNNQWSPAPVNSRCVLPRAQSCRLMSSALRPTMISV